MVREAASVGFPVAIHAVEEAEVEAAVEAIESVRYPRSGSPDRARVHLSSVPHSEAEGEER